MKHFAVEHADGSTSYHRGVGARPAAIGESEGVRWAEIPSAPRFGLDRWDWSAGALVADLAALRAALVAAVDLERERRATSLLTPGGAIGLAYARKADEATRFQAGELLSADRFPFMAAEAEATSRDLAAVAADVAAARARTDAGHARIEAAARAAKVAIRAASTEAAMRAAADLFLEAP
jgi:hypothetical protein